MLSACLSAGGAGIASADPASGAANFKTFASGQIARALAGAKELQARVAAKDVEGAKKAWIAAREGWERSETFAGEFFPDLDEKIDSWPDAKQGFHAIESRLFGAGDLDGVAPMADALVENLASLDARLGKADLSAQGLLDGTANLAYEIGENKASGGESAVSGTSLADMRHNVQGIETAYRMVLEPGLRAKDRALAEQAGEQIEAMETALKVSDLKSLDQALLRKLSEDLTVSLQTAAPKLGLQKPKLED